MPMVFIVIPLVSYDERFWPLVILAALFMPLYIATRDGFTGAGIGKKIMGIHVVDARTNLPVSFKKNVHRQPYFFSTSLITTPLWALFAKKNNRGAGDVVAGTKVVRKK